MSTPNPLASLQPPWVHLVVTKKTPLLSTYLSYPDDAVVRLIRGARCRTKAGLLGELAQALQFPEYFGHNWDALTDCVTDLSWLPAPAYSLVVDDADLLLADDRQDFTTFIAIMQGAGHMWGIARPDAPAIPFHLVLAFTDHSDDERGREGDIG